MDFLGPDPPNAVLDETLEHVWKRLHITFLHGHESYKRALKEGGWKIECYEALDAHVCYGYALLEAAAREGEFKSADGALLADNYAGTVRMCLAGQVGMNLVRAVKL